VALLTHDERLARVNRAFGRQWRTTILILEINATADDQQCNYPHRASTSKPANLLNGQDWQVVPLTNYLKRVRCHCLRNQRRESRPVATARGSS